MHAKLLLEGLEFASPLFFYIFFDSTQRFTEILFIALRDKLEFLDLLLTTKDEPFQS